MRTLPASGLIIAEKYKLLELIGSGGMGEVYRARNTLIGRDVALKLLNHDYVGDANLTARLFQEAKSASRIRHPGIVEVLDAGEAETGPYLVMELLSGRSAAAILVRYGRFDLAAALSTAIPVLSTLGAAHAVGVVHRDLKPENIFFHQDESGQISVKLLDFGIAKLLSPGGPTPKTSTGIVFGTPDYLSPEQAAGDGEIDGRSDLFSLAVVLYELITGVRPFHAPTTIATAYRIAHAKAPPLATNGGPKHPMLDAILQRALSKRPEERHQSADELLAELAEIVPERDRIAALHRIVGGREQDMETSGVRPAVAPPAKRTRPNEESAKLPINTRSVGLTKRSRYRPTPAQSAPASLTPVRPSQQSTPVRPSPARAAVQSKTPLGTLRAIPPRFAEKCSVRGSILRSLDAHVVQQFGREAREEVAACLGPERSADLVNDTLQAIVPYDLDLVAAYIELVTRRYCRGNNAWCRVAGESAVGGEFAASFRHLTREHEVEGILRRAVPLLSRLFDFGRWEHEAAERHTIRISDFEPAPLGLRWWLLGVLDGLLASASQLHTLSVARGDAAFAPQLVLEVSPRY